MSKHEDLAELLHSIGWKSPCDAQWTNLRDALPKILDLIAPEGQAVAKITVDGNRWHMDYLCLPEGTHKLYLRSLVLAAAPSRDAQQEKDAARYRWLRSQAYGRGCDGWLDFDVAIQMPRIFDNGMIDSAIDAALSQSAQSAETEK